MSELTKAVRASKTFPSLRTTIPMSIVKQFGIKNGDLLSWQMMDLHGEIVVVFTKYDSNTPFPLTSLGKVEVTRGPTVETD